MILLIDNYDSFTWNLYHGLASEGVSVEVVRNDAASVDELLAREPRAVVLSPGPGHPRDAGICLELIERLPDQTPLLGVCLGHQALVAATGGALEIDTTPVHGRASLVHHEAARLLLGLPNPFNAGRYHSLRASRDALPEALKLVAWTEDGAVMGVEHRELPRFGLQFHPESILTPQGQRIFGLFLAEAGLAVTRPA